MKPRRPQAREPVVIAVLRLWLWPRGWLYRFPISGDLCHHYAFGYRLWPGGGLSGGRGIRLCQQLLFWAGAYTPWQMFAYGAGGNAGGLPVRQGQAAAKSVGSWPRSAFWPVSCLSAHCWTPARYLTLPIINAQTAWPLYISGFPVNISQRRLHGSDHGVVRPRAAGEAERG